MTGISLKVRFYFVINKVIEIRILNQTIFLVKIISIFAPTDFSDETMRKISTFKIDLNFRHVSNTCSSKLSLLVR